MLYNSASSAKLKMATRGLQNGRWVLEKGLPLGYGALKQLLLNKLSWECHTRRHKLGYNNTSTGVKYQLEGDTANTLLMGGGAIGVGTPHNIERKSINF